MKKFIYKLIACFFIVSIPGIFLLALYCYSDPFRIIRKYDFALNSPVPLNRDYVSTELYLSQKDKFKYNSFIFGSSRAISFNADSWKTHLDSGAIPFKFDAAGEGLFGIYTKIKFLDTNHLKMDNALILFCRNAISETENSDRHLSIKDPKVSGEGWLKFHFVSLKAFLNIKFLMGYYYYELTGKQNGLTNGIIQVNKISLDTKSNQIKIVSLDSLLNADLNGYYAKRKNIFYKREGDTFEKKNLIEDKQLKMLKEIKRILEKNKTNYKIILTPLYDEIKFSPQDQKTLTGIFGENLFDFTGKNEITENITNWYETDHFRPFVADSMMNIVYKK